MENLLFLGVPIFKHITVYTKYSKTEKKSPDTPRTRNDSSTIQMDESIGLKRVTVK